MLTGAERSSGSFTAPMSFAQQRLWLLDQITPGSATYGVPRALRLRGPLDVRALQAAIQAIVVRHESLRTHFTVVDDEPMQIVQDAIDVPFVVVDLSDAVISPADREARAEQLIVAEAALGFDLARGPLIRVTLVRLHGDEHVLLVAMHHIVTDEWSSAVFNRELGAFYDLALRGRTLELDELPIQYADYAAWQRESLQGSAFDEQLAYWRARLAGAPPRVALPTDDLQNVGSEEGAAESLLVSRATARRLRELGTSRGATPFMTLLAAFNLLLYRYTGQSDLVVGSPIVHRNRDELEGLIGFFLNTLALRTQLDPNETFTSLLDRVRDATLNAFAHQDLPFERIVAELDITRTRADVPLINVFFQMDTGPESPPRFNNLAVEPYRLATTTAKFDLSLAIAETADGLRCTFNYRTNLFSAERISRMLNHFATLLDGIAEAPERKLAMLPLLNAQERHQVLVAFNNSAVVYPRDVTLLDLLEAQATRTPSAIALAWEVSNDETLTLDYAELHRRAEARARQLRALGIGPDVGVGICLERSVDLVVALLAVFKAGGYYVPLDPDYPRDRLAFMLEDSQVRVLLTHSRFLAAFVAPAAKVVLVDEATPASVASAPEQRPGPTNLAYMIYTSGSTGRPKGASNRHAGIVNRLLWMQERYGLRADDVVLHKTSFSFDVSVWELLWPLTTGARLFLAQPGGQRDPAYLIDVIARRAVTIAHFVPSMLRLFLAADGVGRAGSLRHLISSGEALPADLVGAFYAHLPAELHNLYGPTEAAIEVTHFTCPRDWARATIPIGRPVANTQIYILDGGGQPVPIGVPGELYIGGVQVGAGYHRRPELTSEKFVPDPFGGDPAKRLYKTGDLASFQADGTIEYRGRLDSQVKVNGFRIELGEIENVLRRQSNVRDAAVVVQTHATDDARLVAYVVADEAVGSPDAWRGVLARTLPAYMLPSVVLVPKLPLMPNGKLDYNALPHAGGRSAASIDDHSNLLYHQLIGMWEDVLGLSPVGIHDNFFTLGGHSLLAVRLIAAMSRGFETPFPAQRFFEEPTIAHVASVLLEGMKADNESPLVPLQPAGTKAPFFYIDGDLHGGGYYVRGLARRLGDDQPLYALHMPGTNARVFPTSIETIAVDYLALIEQVRPHGPYVLGGFCSGALIAYEIACLLQAKHERVEQLIFLESFGSNAELTTLADVSERVLRSIKVGAGRRFTVRTGIGRLAYAVRQGSRQLRRLRTFPKAYFPRLARVLSERLVTKRGDPLRARWDQLTVDYIPGRYRGRIDVFMARQDGPFQPDGREPSWAHVVDRVEKHPIPGSHLTCITRHIDETAVVVNACLAKTT